MPWSLQTRDTLILYAASYENERLIIIILDFLSYLITAKSAIFKTGTPVQI